MINQTKIIVDKDKKTTHIQDLVIENGEVFKFLKDKKSEDLEEWVKKAFIIGIVGLKQMVLTDNMDFVEKEFKEFLVKAKETFKEQSQEIDNKIDNTFSITNTESPVFQLKNLINDYFDQDKGKLKEVIGEYFDKDQGHIKKVIDDTFKLDNKSSAISKLVEEIEKSTKLEENAIKSLLNPNSDDSPIRILRDNIMEKFKEMRENDIKELGKNITDIRDEVLKETDVQIEREKGTAKGGDFEEIVYNELENITAPYSDTVEATGATNGVTNKKGDIIVDIDGDKNKRIVVECKDSQGYSAKKVRNEINESIKNRRANFGIFLFKTSEIMPNEFAPIKITENFIVTNMNQVNLHVCYRLAKLILIRNNCANDESVDFDKINKEISIIEEQIKNINNMQLKVTNIINSGNYLEKNLTNLHNQIEECLNNIMNHLGDRFSKIEMSEESNELIE